MQSLREEWSPRQDREGEGPAGNDLGPPEAGEIGMNGAL